MRQVVICQFALLQQRVDVHEAGLWAIAHGNGHGAIEMDYRRRLNAYQLVVKRNNLPPVGRSGRFRLCMNGRNRSLQCVWAEAAGTQGFLHQGHAFGDLSAVPERVTFPADIWRLADPRWQKLGYPSLSAYITGLIRYDLLVGGPHASNTADCRSKLQRKLTRKTLADRRKGRRRKLLLDHLIEEKQGRPVPQEELERVKASIAQELRRFSLTR